MCIMNKEKQIEEMASVLMANEIYETLMLEAECPLSGMDCAIIAALLVSKGYRKASEVAREIIAIIERLIISNEYKSKGVNSEVWRTNYSARKEAFIDIKNIIKKKYTEGER